MASSIRSVAVLSAAAVILASSCVIGLAADTPGAGASKVESIGGGDTPAKAARSVHLSYIAPSDGPGYTAFYNEETVEKTTKGSYFQTCGFANGYFGIQDHGDGKKVAIFSVWDPVQSGDNAKAVAKEDQIEMLYVGKGVRASRFGGEGTGAHSDCDYDWKVGDTVHFYLTAVQEGTKTTYTAFIQQPGGKSWEEMASFRTPSNGKLLRGLYSFIEDFRRDTESATEVRRAVYGNAWVQDPAGQWLPVTKARFTASSATWEAKNGIDAGVDGDHFYLQTGGETTSSTPLKGTIERSQPAGAKPPTDLPTAQPTDTSKPQS